MLLNNKIALITGASRGIGAAVAKRYIQEGAHVILVAKTISGLESIDDFARSLGRTSTIVPLDLAEVEKIDELSKIIEQRFGYIDILVGNAAIIDSLSPISQIKPKSWNKVMEINLNANWRLIKAFDLLLKKASHGRAIFVTSEVANNPIAYWGAYAVSKAALEMLVKIYAAEISHTNVKANLVDPGTIATDMLMQVMPGLDRSKLTLPEQITDIFVSLAIDDCKENGEIKKAIA